MEKRLKLNKKIGMLIICTITIIISFILYNNLKISITPNIRELSKASMGAKTGPIWAKAIGSAEGSEIINSAVDTKDGGYIVAGQFNSETVDLGNGIILNNQGGTDGMIVKYNSENELEWAKPIGGEQNDFIESIVQTNDEGYVAVGNFKSNTLDFGNNISVNKVVQDSIYTTDMVIVKYNNKGEAQWAKSIGAKEGHNDIKIIQKTSDGGFVVGGSFNSLSVNIGNNITLSNSSYSKDHQNTCAFFIKYNNNGIPQWAKTIGGSYSNYIYSVAQTKDGSYIVGGQFTDLNTINLGNNVKLTNTSSYWSDNTSSLRKPAGMIIKYSSTGTPQWAKSICGNNLNTIYSVAQTKDGGYIVGGKFQAESINLESKITLTNKGYSDGMIIKYSSTGTLQWAKNIGGNANEYIKSVQQTNDGGYIVGGYYNSESIDLGNEVLLTNNTSSFDVVIIKYNSSGIPQWTKSIGGNKYDSLNSLTLTSDDGFIVAGSFQTISMDVGNGIILNNSNQLEDKSTNDGMVMKFLEYDYIVQYNGNGHTSGNTPKSYHIFDTSKNLTSNGFKREYTVKYDENYTNSNNITKTAKYSFKNWTSNADGTGDSYENNEEVLNLTSTIGETINLYAQWETSSVNYTPERTGYTFEGWYKDSACT